MKIMNYIVIATMIITLALSSAFAVAQTDETGISNTGMTDDVSIDGGVVQPTAVSSGIQTTASNTGSEEDRRIVRCITYLKNNNLDRQPAVTCLKLLKKEINCVQFLKGKNVNSPVAVCDKLFAVSAPVVKKRIINAQSIRSHNAVGAGVAQKVPDWRLRRIDSAIENNPGAEEKIKALTEEKARVFSHLSRAQQSEMLQLGNAEMQEKMKNYQLVKTKKMLVNKKRIIAKQKLLKAEKDYMIAKQNYAKIKVSYQNRYAKFLAVKKKLKECNGSDSPECEKLREQAQEHANDVVAKSAEMLINHLSKIKHRIESEENINQTRADEIIANIDAAIVELNDAKTQENAQTKEELKEAAKKIRNIWAKTRHWENVWRARLVHAKVWGLIKRAEHLEERMDQTVSNMQEAGIGTTAIEEKISLYSQNIVDAKNKTKQAETLIREAHDIRKDNANLTDEQKEEIRSKLKEADSLARAVNDNLKKAHRLIIEIAKDIRKSKGNIAKTVAPAVDPELSTDEQYEIVETEASDDTDEDEDN